MNRSNVMVAFIVVLCVIAVLLLVLRHPEAGYGNQQQQSIPTQQKSQRPEEVNTPESERAIVSAFVKRSAVHQVDITGAGELVLNGTATVSIDDFEPFPVGDARTFKVKSKATVLAESEVGFKFENGGAISIGTRSVQVAGRSEVYVIDNYDSPLSTNWVRIFGDGSLEIANWQTVQIHGKASVKANDCEEVATWDESSATVTDCKEVHAMDRSKILAKNCREAGASGNAFVEVEGDAEIWSGGQGQVIRKK